MQDLQFRDHRGSRHGIIGEAAGQETAVLGIDEPLVYTVSSVVALVARLAARDGGPEVDAAVQPASFCSASHSMEPIAHTVLVLISGTPSASATAFAIQTGVLI